MRLTSIQGKPPPEGKVGYRYVQQSGAVEPASVYLEEAAHVNGETEELCGKSGFVLVILRFRIVESELT